MNVTWTPAEKLFIQQNADKFTDDTLTVELNKMSQRNISKAAVRKARHRMGIKKKPGRGKCELI